MPQRLRWHQTRSRRVAALGVALLLATSAAWAQADDPGAEPPEGERGLGAQTAYQSGLLDHVNLFNGGLTLALPLGGRYPVGAGFSWGLGLGYTSNLWDMRRVGESCAPGSEVVRFTPARHFNAGLGFAVGPPQLVLPAMEPMIERRAGYYLVGPDGSVRTFRFTLHDGDADEPGEAGSANAQRVLYTRDGSYLRLEVVEVAGEIDHYRVESPDGSVQVFDRDGWATRLEDAFGNGVSITPPGDRVNRVGTWLFEDDHGREARIELEVGAGGKGRVASIHLPAFGGGQEAVYRLAYTSNVPVAQPNLDTSCANGTHTVLDLLTRLTLPDHSFYEFTAFDPASRAFGGLVTTARLPAGGRIGWVYGFVELPTSKRFAEVPPPENPAAGLETSFAVGVATKRSSASLDPGAPFESEWSYLHRVTEVDRHRPGVLDYFQEKVTRVIAPDGLTTYHYFATRPDWSYALPFSWRHRDPASPGRYLSQLVVDATRRAADEDPTAGDIPNVPPADPLRATYVRYTGDQYLGSRWFGSTELNQRQVESRTYFYDRASGTDRDPCASSLTAAGQFHFVDERASDFDGLGHFRTLVRGGNLDAEDAETVRVAYDRTTTTYDFDLEAGTAGPDHDFVMLGAEEPWILGVSSGASVEDEAGEIARTEHCFDRSTGRLLRRRTIADDTQGNRGARDVLEVFQADAAGNVTAELRYGGDEPGQTLGTGALCTLALPATPAFRLAHGHQWGALARSAWVDPAAPGEEVLRIRDDTIDHATGFVATARDAAGVEAGYLYDEMGRVTRLAPEGEARYDISYAAPASTTRARVEVSRIDGSGDTLAQEKFVFDGLGRTVEEHQRLPATNGGETWSRRLREFDGSGRLLRQSTLGPLAGAGSSPTWTSQSFDDLGRVCREIRPDGGATKSWHEGIRLVIRRTDVRTLDGLAGQLRTYVADRHGRVQQVTERSEPAGTDFASRLEDGDPILAPGRVSTYSEYDPAGRLIRVFTPLDSGPPYQERTFDYDGRGFLLAECHPEKGQGGGCVAYGGYDALGNALGRVDGVALAYRYDRAGRLTQVARANGCTGSGCLEKEFFYGRQNSGANLRAGKLHQAKRHNRVVDPENPHQTTDYVVTETYRYEGQGGRVSGLRTAMAATGLANTGAWSFTQAFTYDPMGNLAAEVYPRCDHAGCAGNDPSRTITSVFDQGLLVGVPGFAPRLTYHANGALATVDHANGVTDMVSIAADKMARPVEISAVRGGNTLWGTGAYTYDASGNVTAMGADQFWYDQVSRLTRADVVVDAATISETYSHDRFGNLLALAGATGTRSWSVDPRSNRVTTSGWAYDQSGNVTADPAGTFSWDALHALTAATGTGKNETYLYTAGDERVAVIDRHESPDRLRFSLRGLSGEVLRRYESQVAASAHGERWTWHQDYVYRGAALLASIKPSSTDPGGAIEHFHLDHLGTPRLKTNAAGQVSSRHTYAPYGEELTAANLSSEAMRFTVHERDQDPAGWGNDLDYMHARYCSPRTGRFLSVDPVADLERLSLLPQRWNRYLYAAGNPTNLLDPTGLYVVTDEEGLEAIQEALREAGSDATVTLETVEVSHSFLGFEWTTTEQRVTSETDLSSSDNPTVGLIGAAIATTERTELSITGRDLSESGGAQTSTLLGGRIRISINPAQIAGAVVQGAAIYPTGETSPVGISFSLGTALVHEFGHAYGHFAEGEARFGGNTDVTAVRYENLHRKLLAKDPLPQLQRKGH